METPKRQFNRRADRALMHSLRCEQAPGPFGWTCREAERVAHDIAPTLPLSQSLREWHQISEELADPTRQRRPQLAAYFD